MCVHMLRRVVLSVKECATAQEKSPEVQKLTGLSTTYEGVLGAQERTLKSRIGAGCKPACVIFVRHAARFLGVTLHPASHSSTSDSNQSIRSLPGMRSLGGRLCGRLLASSRIVRGVLCNRMAMSVTERVFNL